MTDFIERLRAKPEYVRRRVALGAASGVTGLVALLWAVSFTSSGALALSPTSDGPRPSFAEKSGASLLSAVGALTKQGGTVTVTGTQASSTVPAPKEEERTVIPF